MTFEVPGLAKSKRYKLYGKRLMLAEDAAEFEQHVGWCARQAGVSLSEGPCKLTTEVIFPIPKGWGWERARKEFHTRKPDASNLQKCVEDSLKGIAWIDDAQIVETICRKKYGDEPKVIISIEHL